MCQFLHPPVIFKKEEHHRCSPFLPSIIILLLQCAGRPAVLSLQYLLFLLGHWHRNSFNFPEMRPRCFPLDIGNEEIHN